MALQLSHPGLAAMGLVAAGDITGESERLSTHLPTWLPY